MRDRYTHKSRTSRENIPKRMRYEVYQRDKYICTYWVTCCSACNQRKAASRIYPFTATQS